MHVKGELGNFSPEGKKGLEDYVLQKDLMSYFDDIRKVKQDMEENRVRVADNTYQYAITRGSLGGISVLGTIFLILWKLKGKIRHLQLMRSQPQANFLFPFPMSTNSTSSCLCSNCV